MLPSASHVLANKYRLVSPLRAGGMGTVWTAEHLSLNSAVAIKILDEGMLDNHEAVTRFLREARAAAQIRSPNVVQIFDVGVDNGIPFIAMELLQGESLAERLERVRSISPVETAQIMAQVARGVARAHAANLVHRDLKPGNIFLERDGEDEVAKVLDFGIAKALVPGFDPQSGATRTGTLIGSPHYMSPEQAEGASSLDHRTDIWSMGVMACECLTGVRPFEQASLGAQLLAICAWPMPVPSRLGQVPLGFDAWFARACARDPRRRFATVREAAQELSTLSGNRHSSRPPIAADTASDSSPGAIRRAAVRRGVVSLLASIRAMTHWRLVLACIAALLVVLGLLLSRGASTPGIPRAPAVTVQHEAAQQSPALQSPPPSVEGGWPTEPEAVPMADPLPHRTPLAPAFDGPRTPIHLRPSRRAPARPPLQLEPGLHDFKNDPY